MSLAFDETNLAVLVQERIDRWRTGGAPDAAAFLDEHPELRRARSLVLELILEEYCLRREAGDEVVKSAFCERFPSVRQSVFKMLEVREFLDKRPEFAAELKRLDWPLPGDHFMGFDIVELLGCGALARVYLAREPALGRRKVVVKVSRYGAGEAETLGKLSHPSIVPVHSVQHDEVTGWTVICMPLLGTATAVDLLDAAFANGQKPVDASIISRVIKDAGPRGVELGLTATESPIWRGSYDDAIARIGCQIAEALEEAHAQGVLHRDIKPSNLLLAWSGRPMLLDFNLSADQEVSTPRIGGTPAYMAPETIASLMQKSAPSAGPLDPRSDIYSLGAVLFELLAGKLPARPENADRLALDDCQPWWECKQSPPPALAAIAPGIDPRLEAIVQKCLAVDPQGRYATAGSLAQALRTYLGIAPSLTRLAKRNWRFALTACLLAIAGFVGGWSYVATRPPYYEQLMSQGLAEYDGGKYSEAAATLGRCLSEKPDLPEAHFARGQAYRRLREWNKARTEFLALKSVHEAWAYALAGECNIDLDDNTGARNDMLHAYGLGLRDVRFLLNYADVLRKYGLGEDAVIAYGDVLEIDPRNSAALCNRAITSMDLAVAARRKPDAYIFADAHLYVELNPGSFEACYAAARVFACDASENKQHQEAGSQYLASALRRGLPRDLIERQRAKLRPLLTSEIEALIKAASPQDPSYRYRTFERLPPPQAADWRTFLHDNGGGVGNSLAIRN